MTVEKKFKILLDSFNYLFEEYNLYKNRYQRFLLINLFFFMLL